MKVPLSWLGDYVEISSSAAELAGSLLLAGVGIESIEGDVLDLEIAANRGDLLSILGVAREVGFLLGREARAPEVKYPEVEEEAGRAWEVEVPAPDLCTRYTARVIRGVRVGPSPGWMAERLGKAGIRAINNIVDITNYVLLESGQPLHAFDARFLRGRKIVVRRAAAGERIVAIDGKTYDLTGEMLVIADADRPAALAGVMGGKESEIGPATRDVLIESAQFDPVSIRRTSRRLGLASESSYRFERGVDFDAVDWASRRAVRLILQHAGGEALRGSVDVSVPPPARPVARVRPARVSKVLGIRVSPARVREILAGLGCRVSGTDEVLEAVGPPGRRDLRIEEDYIEEVARIESYERIPGGTSFPQRVVEDGKEDLVRAEVRSTLTGLGAFEVLTWSFTDAGTSDPVPYWSEAPPVPLRDPLGRVDRLLRRSLVPGMLRVLQTNEGYKEGLRPIFEIARVYFRKEDGYGEKTVLGLASPGDPLGLKGLLEVVVGRLGLRFGLIPKDGPGLGSFLVPGTSAELSVEDRAVGFLGMPRPALGALRSPVSVAEVDFQALVGPARLVSPYREVPRQPPMERELSVILPEGATWRELEAALRESAPLMLESVRFLGEYRGRPIPAGRKSWHFSMVFRAPDRTLVSDEVEAAVRAIVTALERRLNARLR